MGGCAVGYEGLSATTPMAQCGVPLQGDPAFGAPGDRVRDAAKRLFDVIGAVVLLAALAPVLALIALAVKADSPGPVLYTQVRAGRHRRVFGIYKFRSMVTDAEELLAGLIGGNVHQSHGDTRLYKIADDPRVTRIGAFLRRHSLDELPQLVNVVVGEMSLVGPRPLTLEEDRHVAGTARARASVRPGMTGPWQVNGRNALTFEDMMRLDTAYVTGLSLRTDIALLVRTIPVVVRPQQAC